MNPRPRPSLGRLYAIADAAALGVAALPAAVATMAAEGIGTIQLRAKSANDAELYRLAEACARAVEGSAATLWMNDRADLAAMLGWRGLHLGQEDLPAVAARQTLAESVWIGLSTHDAGQLAAADADEAVDVIACGPVFPTRSRENPAPVVGIAGVRAARAGTAKPLVAIGGIDAENLKEVLAAGADAVAVLSAFARGDLRRNCRRLLAAAA
jgi:thiamine-phosphate pyrophosphorylase